VQTTAWPIGSQLHLDSHYQALVWRTAVLHARFLVSLPSLGRNDIKLPHIWYHSPTRPLCEAHNGYLCSFSGSIPLGDEPRKRAHITVVCLTQGPGRAAIPHVGSFAKNTRCLAASTNIVTGLQVASRSLDFTEGSFLVPLLDIATHLNNCTNIIAIKDCEQLLPGRHAPEGPTSNKGSSKDARAVPNDTAWCVYLEAGTDLAPGDQVCIQRGYMLPDKAMLQHNVLVTEMQTPQAVAAVAASISDESLSEVPLFGMDRHDFAKLAQDHLPWMYPTPVPPIPFTGALSAIHQQDLHAACKHREYLAV